MDVTIKRHKDHMIEMWDTTKEEELVTLKDLKGKPYTVKRLPTKEIRYEDWCNKIISKLARKPWVWELKFEGNQCWVEKSIQ